MEVLLVLVLVSALVLLASTIVWKVPARRAWPGALRSGLAAMFAVTGVSHFVGLRDDMVAMVPPALPFPELLVTVTGVLELAGAVGLLYRPVASWAAGSLAVLLVLMFPANVYAAVADIELSGEPPTALLPRTLMQVVFVGAALAVTWSTRGQAARRPSARVGVTAA